MAALFDAAVAFFTELERDNSRAFWERERSRYDRDVRPVFVALCDHLRTFGAWRVYRPHNDVRFAKDRAPYKTFIGAVAERPDGVGAFVRVSASGLLVGTGVPQPAPDQLARLRAAIADEDFGSDFVRAVDASARAGAHVHGGRWDPLRRVPGRLGNDHPRATWLRWKGVEATQRVAEPVWATVEEAARAVDALLGTAAPLHGWLARHVGASLLTPQERFAPRRRS